MADPSVKLTIAALSVEARQVFGGRYLVRFAPSQSTSVLLIVESQTEVQKLFSSYGVQVNWTPVEHELASQGASTQVFGMPDSISLFNLMTGIRGFSSGDS